MKAMENPPPSIAGMNIRRKAAFLRKYKPINMIRTIAAILTVFIISALIWDALLTDAAMEPKKLMPACAR